jgi:hypothetical protein
VAQCEREASKGELVGSSVGAKPLFRMSSGRSGDACRMATGSDGGMRESRGGAAWDWAPPRKKVCTDRRQGGRRSGGAVGTRGEGIPSAVRHERADKGGHGRDWGKLGRALTHGTGERRGWLMVGHSDTGWVGPRVGSGRVSGSGLWEGKEFLISIINFQTTQKSKEIFKNT